MQTLKCIDRSMPAVCLGFLDAAFISQEGFEGMKHSPEFTYDDGSLLKCIDRSMPAVCLGFLDAAFISQEGFEGMKHSPEFTYDDGSLLS